eukprot:GILK01001735.1.p1 GENE.GILK01001735.1~~GILK01001735.1.p1  ORF type:complete len:490 (-),score=76.05 GILK01001735.1:728-2197(-)
MQCLVLLVLLSCVSAIVAQSVVEHQHDSLNDLDLLKRPLRVAVVGAGVGGASAAQFVRDALGPEAELVVFERDERVGGRTTTSLVGDFTAEAGASIYHEKNKHFHDAAVRCGFKPVRPKGEGRMGIWNGKELIWQESSWGDVFTLGSLLLRYGLSPLRVKNIVQDALHRFLMLYELPTPWKTVEEALQRVDLLSWTNITTTDLLLRSGVSPLYVNEFITAVTRVQYGQNVSTLHGLQDLIAMCGTSELFHIPKGNFQVAECMLKNATAAVLHNTTVKSITKTASNLQKYTVEGIRTNSKGETVDVSDTFDAVVIATPLEFTNISFVNMQIPDDKRMARDYQTIYSTFVVGLLNQTYFHQSATETGVGAVLTTEESKDLPFTSMSRLHTFNDTYSNMSVFKFFSRKPLKEEELDRLFVQRVHHQQVSWQAYPVQRPIGPDFDMHGFPPVYLDDHIYYVNAFESATSCMECSMVSAANIARLIQQDLSRSS